MSTKTLPQHQPLSSIQASHQTSCSFPPSSLHSSYHIKGTWISHNPFCWFQAVQKHPLSILTWSRQEIITCTADTDVNLFIYASNLKGDKLERFKTENTHLPSCRSGGLEFFLWSLCCPLQLLLAWWPQWYHLSLSHHLSPLCNCSHTNNSLSHHLTRSIKQTLPYMGVGGGDDYNNQLLKYIIGDSL